MKLLPRAPLAAHRAQVTRKHKRGLNDDPLGDEQAQTPTPTGPTPPTPKKKKKKKGVRHGSKGSGIGGSKEAAALDNENLLLTNADAGHGAAGIVVTGGDMPYGGLIVYNATDDYSPDTGTGTYRALIDLNGNITITGTLYATAGTIGGWTIAATTLSSGNITLNSATPKVTIGSATDYLTGDGVFMGLHSGAYKFRVGSTTKYFAFDGSNPTTSGNWIDSAGVETSLQTWTTNIVFSSASATQVNWTSGTIRLNDGRTFSISSGNTGTMSALNYIYLDTAVSSTVLQKTTTYSTAVGSGKVLIAAAQNDANAIAASVIPYGGQQPIVNGAQIAALSIVAGNIAAGAITATKISVTSLSAISADMGTITAGTVTGATIRTASSGARTEMNASNLFGAGYGGIGGTDGTTTQWYAKASDGKLYAGGGKVVSDATGFYATDGTNRVFTIASTAYTLNSESLSVGDVIFGSNASSSNNTKINSSGMIVRSGTTDMVTLNGGGVKIGGVLNITRNSTTVSSGTIDLDVGASATFLYSYYYISSASGNFTIRGIATPVSDGAMLFLVNGQNTYNMTLQNSGSPGAGYSKITTFTGADASTTGNGNAILIYDLTADRWELFAING